MILSEIYEELSEEIENYSEALSTFTVSFQDIINKQRDYYENLISKFISKISSSYDLNPSEIDDIYLGLKKKGKEQKKEKKIEKPEDRKKNSCEYFYLKKDSYCIEKKVKGTKYCINHQKSDGIVPKIIKPSGNLTIKFDIKSKKYYHPDTFFIFKSKEEKVVVGKLIDGKIKSLTKDDIEICKDLKFKYSSD